MGFEQRPVGRSERMGNRNPKRKIGSQGGAGGEAARSSKVTASTKCAAQRGNDGRRDTFSPRSCTRGFRLRLSDCDQLPRLRGPGPAPPARGQRTRSGARGHHSHILPVTSCGTHLRFAAWLPRYSLFVILFRSLFNLLKLVLLCEDCVDDSASTRIDKADFYDYVSDFFI